MLFNEDGLLALDEKIINSQSFKAIMEDGIVTNEEFANQAQLVTDLLHQAEDRFSAEDVQFIERILVETNVLYAIYQKMELQHL